MTDGKTVPGTLDEKSGEYIDEFGKIITTVDFPSNELLRNKSSKCVSRGMTMWEDFPECRGSKASKSKKAGSANIRSATAGSAERSSSEEKASFEEKGAVEKGSKSLKRQSASKTEERSSKSGSAERRCSKGGSAELRSSKAAERRSSQEPRRSSFKEPEKRRASRKSLIQEQVPINCDYFFIGDDSPSVREKLRSTIVIEREQSAETKSAGENMLEQATETKSSENKAEQATNESPEAGQDSNEQDSIPYTVPLLNFNLMPRMKPSLVLEEQRKDSDEIRTVFAANKSKVGLAGISTRAYVSLARISTGMRISLGTISALGQISLANGTRMSSINVARMSSINLATRMSLA